MPLSSFLLIFSHRQNPLGKVFTKEELLAIGTLCVKKNLVILCDEVYERIHFMPSFTHIAALNDAIAAHTLTVGSIGKLFNATGWRLGFVIGPAQLIGAVQSAHTLLCYTTAGPVQEAAAFGLAEAESSGWWEENMKQVKGKVARFCEVLDELGLPVSMAFTVHCEKQGFVASTTLQILINQLCVQYVKPEGAYFVFANIKNVALPSDYPFPTSITEKTRDYRVSWYLTQEFGISSIPGSGESSQLCHLNPSCYPH